MKKITVFTLPNCKNCIKLKNYLNIRNIKYNLIDVSQNKKALEYIKENRCKKAPSILINRTFICGFDRIKIDKILGN
jgi:glutaredoxin 3